MSGYNNGEMMLTVHSVFFGQHLCDHIQGLNVFLKSPRLFVQNLLAVFLALLVLLTQVYKTEAEMFSLPEVKFSGKDFMSKRRPLLRDHFIGVGMFPFPSLSQMVLESLHFHPFLAKALEDETQ